MAKPLGHFAILVVVFFGTWFLLGKIDFMSLFHVEQFTRENERKLGTLIFDAVKSSHEELEADSVKESIDSIKRRLCGPAGIEDSSITLHILVEDDVNAFALPDRHLILYTGLIQYCNSPEELAGVMAHEISHMELRHVTKKLVKDAGLSMLTTVAEGGSNDEITRQMVRILSSTAFDREQETEADTSAARMMAAANIKPEHLANFLFRLSQEKENIPKNFEWLSTHPNSQDRSSEILKFAKHMTIHPVPILDSTSWESLRKAVITADDRQTEKP